MKIFSDYQIQVLQEALWAAIMAAAAFAATYLSNAEGAADWRTWAIAGVAGAGRVAIVAGAKALTKVFGASVPS